jgi:hypothetical protein
MFCPQCSAENNLRQKYCRRCGLQLTAALIALRGSADDALTRYLKGGKLLAVGSIFLIFSVLATLANITHSSGPWNSARPIDGLLSPAGAQASIAEGTTRHLTTPSG